MQVRAQSKELSMKIRDRVAREKHRQLRNVEEIKRRELSSWKEKHVNNTMADYYYCLSNVGDAHVAAERENELTEKMNEQQRENRKIAVLRGRKALEKERLKNVKKNERLVKRKAKTNVVHKNAPHASSNAPNVLNENDKTLSDDDGNQLSESDDELIAEELSPVHDIVVQSPDTHRSDPIDSAQREQGVRFSQVSDLIEQRRRARSVCDQLFESGSSTSKLEHFSKSTEPCTKSPPGKPLYTPKSIQTKSPQTKPFHAPKSPKRTTTALVHKSPVREFIPKPHQFSHTATAKGSKIIDSQRSVIGNAKKAIVTPNKVTKSKNAIATTTTKFVSPPRREFVPRFTKNTLAQPGILKNKATTTDPTTTDATTSPEKVQFYDHFSRYGKEIDAIPGMVIRESQQPPTMNATEAARVQNELDEIRFRQLDELR